MRTTVISTMLIFIVLAAVAAPVVGQEKPSPSISILNIRTVNGHALRIDIATSGLDPQPTDLPDVTLEVWLDGVPARGSLLLIHMPPRFSMDVDLPAGAIRLGVVKVGEFHPVRPFTENMRFPVQVTLRQGPRVATASRTVTMFLPTVIVPGYMNELGGRNEEALAAFIRRGYRDDGTAPTLFWFGYPSHQLTLEEAAHKLAEYVRQVVLTQAYAAKINVVGYSLGGLMARWNVEYDVDGWGTLVNRLILVGVPNEGSVMAYVHRNAPTFLPFAYFAHASAAHEMMPTFPFWRGGPTQPWSMPQEADNPVLAQLNTRPIPGGIRVWVFYGESDPQDPAASNTLAGITETPSRDDSASGDGIVLAASAQGLPIHGGSGVASLMGPDVSRASLGSVGHSQLLAAGADRFVAALLDRFINTVDEMP